VTSNKKWDTTAPYSYSGGRAGPAVWLLPKLIHRINYLRSAPSAERKGHETEILMGWRELVGFGICVGDKDGTNIE